MGKRREGKEEEKGEEEEEERAEEGVEQVANTQDNANDVVMMSRSTDHLSTTMNNRSVAPHNSPTPTTSLEPVPTNPSAHSKSVEPPGLWCDPVTVTLEQIEEKTRRLLCEWLNDNGIPFPKEVLEMLRDLKMKIMIRDNERARKTGSLTMADPPVEIPARRANATPETVRMTPLESQARGETNEETTGEECMDAHPTDDDPTNWMPTPLDWAKDVDEPYGVRPVVSVDMRPTEYVDKATIPLPVPYDPRNLSALRSGTQNLWGTLSHCHHHHRHSQPPCDTSTPNSTT